MEEKRKQENKEPIAYNQISDLWSGFKEENLTYMAIKRMNDNSSFPVDENYQFGDPQLAIKPSR